MSKFVLSALVLVLALPSLAAAQLASPVSPDPSRLAIVSPQRAFYQSNDGKAAQARLELLQSERSRETAARSAKLKILQQQLAAGASVLAEAARRERELEIDRFQVDLQRFVEDAQAEFLGVRRNLENAFLAKFAPAVDSVARRRGLLLVLNEDSGVVAWANPSLDITPDVVALVNKP